MKYKMGKPCTAKVKMKTAIKTKPRPSSSKPK